MRRIAVSSLSAPTNSHILLSDPSTIIHSGHARGALHFHILYGTCFISWSYLPQLALTPKPIIEILRKALLDALPDSAWESKKGFVGNALKLCCWLSVVTAVARDVDAQIEIW